jgi:Ca2+-binding RTX toxin-like protein
VTVTVSASDYSLPAGQQLDQPGGSAIFLSSTSAQYAPSVTIAGDVEVTGGATVVPAIGVEGQDYGSYFQDSTVHITSTGVIHVDATGTNNSAQGVLNGSWSPRVINDGAVEVSAKGDATGIRQWGVFDSRDPAPSVLNNGQVTVSSGHYATGVLMGDGGLFVNHGVVSATGAASTSGVAFSQWDSSFINTGEIHAVDSSGHGQAVGVYFDSNITGSMISNPVNLGVWENDGLITGDISLRIAQNSTMKAELEVFHNNGRMVGDVVADYGGQTLVNAGSIQGGVSLGQGDDVYDGSAGTVSGMVSGGDGDDSLSGGAQYDALQGNAGNDTEHGGGGDDIVVGGKDQDQLFGDAGNDIVWGNLGNDTLDGGDGNDQVRGGQGDDVLTGGAGDDWLSGDRGSDTITGGTGADVFHSFSGAGLDVVTDFNAAQGDRVMLDPGTTYTASQVGTDTVIDMGGGDRLVLQHTTLSSLPAGWLFEG